MNLGKSIPRSIRLAQLQHLLHANPKGLTSSELATKCGVCVRTIQRDLLDLQSKMDVPITEEGNRYGLMGGYILPPVYFSLYEAMALFLAARLALRQTDENNPHVQQALTKMAGALPSNLAEQIKRCVQSIATKAAKPEYVRVFEQIAIAWTARRQIRIHYLSLQATDVKEWTVEPYFVEMTGVGFSSYVIGHGLRDGRDGIVTFKLDRIVDAELLDATFEIPVDFDIVSLLLGSWGVIWGEGTTVKLRFSPAVTRRVKESVWHPSQGVQDLPDGGCTWQAQVGSTIEITPWIRSWGPDVEVLEPQELRDEFREWAKKLHEMYR